MNLFQTAAMPLLTCKTGVNECDAQILGQFRANHARAEYQNVHVVVLHALVRRIAIMAEAGANAGNLVGRDRCTHAAAADQDPALGLPLKHAQSDRLSIIRIIHRRSAVSSDRSEEHTSELQS